RVDQGCSVGSGRAPRPQAPRRLCACPRTEAHVMSLQTRQRAQRKGHTAEWRAAWRLRLAGYTILARRYKTKLGEIDIVSPRGNLLAFGEVKARAAFYA